ncbi:ABC transporter permease [Pseudarthrobacter raffinosi]|uniref:ABC transporter permease n=2 Tax=Pseudarthrobacter raffinosi TaxID=2953651 RepID=UPI00208E264E|nr:ABC transporter permease [Pseudarthrobacter sp. MDT3-9]MCO4251559.1 ABC transporter permease [Pseudarthrobacter sp. MDT3-9]
MTVLEKTLPVPPKQRDTLVRRAAMVRWAILAALIVILEVTTRTGMISPALMVSPSEILARLVSIVPTERFGQDAARTLTTILIAFTIGLVLGIPLGVFLWRVPAAGRILEPFIVTGYAMPTLLFYPVLLAVMGLNAGPIILIAASMSLIPIALTTMVALKSIKPILHKLANSVSASPRQYYLKVLFPAATPLIFPGVKLGFIYAVIGTVAMEFILAAQGIGFRAGFYYRELNTADMWAYIAVVIVLSVLVNAVLTRLEKRIRRDML